MQKVKIIFYSMYGHIYQMAEAVKQGAEQVAATQVEIYRVPELVPEAVLEKSGAKACQQAFQHIPIIRPDQLSDADALIFGTPTRFGNMCAQMRQFLDQLGGLWASNALVGKVGSAFTSTGSQHGGQETTLTSFHTNLFHFGMVVVGVPYSETGLSNMDNIEGGTPYGASTITGGDGKRMPSPLELAIASFQGKHVAEISRALKLGRGQ
jgi:NAD(P)H dehydrogenase (quinone)